MEKWFFLKIPNDFAFSLYDLDWDVFTFNIEGAINRVPAIEKTGVKSTVCGPGTSSFYNCIRQIIYGSRYLVSVKAQQRLVLLFIITLVAIQVVITYANLTNTLGAIQVVITYANLRALTNTRTFGIPFETVLFPMMKWSGTWKKLTQCNTNPLTIPSIGLTNNYRVAY